MCYRSVVLICLNNFSLIYTAKYSQNSLFEFWFKFSLSDITYSNIIAWKSLFGANKSNILNIPKETFILTNIDQINTKNQIQN